MCECKYERVSASMCDTHTCASMNMCVCAHLCGQILDCGLGTRLDCTIVNLGQGMDKNTANLTEVQVGLWVPTPQLEGHSQYSYKHLAQLQRFVPD